MRIIVLFVSSCVLFLGIFIIRDSLNPPLEKSEMSSISGKFDHYITSGRYTNAELHLTNGSKYFIEDPEYQVFDEVAFLKNVKKRKEVKLLVYSTSRSNYIMMIKSGKVTYLSFRDAYNSERQDKIWGLVLGSIILLLSIICFGGGIHLTSWRITLNESNDNFIYKTAFGRTYTIFYHDISYYKTGKLALIFKYNGKFFVVNPYAENYRPFLHILIKKDVKKIF
ncbi:hypothetical protein ACFVSW_27415 [Neobacillus sp. NPDC058068]|uniref:hypothetical protein n=1 Tax=Neobacillus sp. NPDC058068 TaxID=3346325 RepID=UPI0036DAA8AF